MSAPPIDEKALLILRDEIDVLKGLLEEIVTAVTMAGVSNYPIFIAHKGETMDLGRPLAEDREGMDWQFRISHLEEKQVAIRAIMSWYVSLCRQIKSSKQTPSDRNNHNIC